LASRDKFDREYRAIIAALQRHRRAVGLTQWDLARALGTDQSQISKLERSERRLDIVDYLRICRAVGLDPGKPLRHAHPAELLEFGQYNHQFSKLNAGCQSIIFN
jgi:transcriptional regulator with XRE-family HTH domain